MSRAGFDPQAMASFLESLDANTNLEARLAGRPPGEQNKFDLFATHPRTADRVRKTIEAARAVKVSNPTVAREIYLGKINGLLYGDDPAQGIVRGRSFIHPGLDVRFDAPPGFQLLNGPAQVVGQNQQGALLRFDLQQVNAAQSPQRYIADDWAAGRQLAGLQSITLNAFPAATASTTLTTDNQQPVTAWLLAIRGAGETMYRFLFLAPQSIAQQTMPTFHTTMQSFRRVTAEERAQAKPLRLRIVTVRRGDTAESLSDRMAYPDNRLDRFLTLNGLQAGARLNPNQLVKIVTE
jgi:predicted Zn-dependent protease